MDAIKQASAADDQELARVLESMNQDLATTPAIPSDPVETAAVVSEDSNMQFEETPAAAQFAQPPSPVAQPVASVLPQAYYPPVDPVATVSPVGVSDLDVIKKDALTELRPLVDKLNLPPEEKFDTLLLIIRSTDDRSLVSVAHEVAKTIEDDSKRAEALLDVIKEIDYFSNPQQ